MTVLISDTECYPNLWSIGFKRVSDGKIVTLEKSDRSKLDRERLERIIRANCCVGFNWRGYDLAMVWAAIWGYSNEKLKELNDQIIVGRVPWWGLDDLLGRRIPWTDHIDLIEPQPNAVASLKTLAGRLHSPRMQGLPYEPDRVLTDAERDEVLSYMANDLDETHRLYDAMREPLELREAIGKDIGVDVRSKSDTQVGMAIIKKRLEDMLGRRLEKPKAKLGASFKYRVPDYIRFQSPDLVAMLERVREHTFIVQGNGKVELPDFLAKEKIRIGEAAYQMGIGGLHSCEANRSVYSRDDAVLIDADVASYYPAIIMTLGLFPEAMGPKMLTAYAGIKADRLAAKRAKDKAKDKGLKISLNGFFGNTSNPHSPAYSPPMTIAITLTGQLSLLMLIERAHLAGIPTVSANTDGATFLCPRDRAHEIADGRLTAWPEGRDISFGSTLKEITDDWERDTGFDLEFVEYRSLHNLSVNSYIAIKADGRDKRKGQLANPWTEDGDMRERLMKNPNMTILSDAVLAFIRDGVPLEQTIRACRDVRQFVTVVNVQGGGTWRGRYLGKVVRYIWSTDGEPIFYKKPNPKTGTHKKVPKTDGAREMMALPAELPADLDYARYVDEAREILRDLGVLDALPVAQKPRVTKKTLATWLTIAAVCD